MFLMSNDTTEPQTIRESDHENIRRKRKSVKSHRYCVHTFGDHRGIRTLPFPGLKWYNGKMEYPFGIR